MRSRACLSRSFLTTNPSVAPKWRPLVPRRSQANRQERTLSNGWKSPSTRKKGRKVCSDPKSRTGILLITTWNLPRRVRFLLLTQHVDPGNNPAYTLQSFFSSKRRYLPVRPPICGPCTLTHTFDLTTNLTPASCFTRASRSSVPLRTLRGSLDQNGA